MSQLPKIEFCDLMDLQLIGKGSYASVYKVLSLMMSSISLANLCISCVVHMEGSLGCGEASDGAR